MDLINFIVWLTAGAVIGWFSDRMITAQHDRRANKPIPSDGVSSKSLAGIPDDCLMTMPTSILFPLDENMVKENRGPKCLQYCSHILHSRTGKVEAWRRFCQELSGSRRKTYEASGQRLGT